MEFYLINNGKKELLPDLQSSEDLWNFCLHAIHLGMLKGMDIVLIESDDFHTKPEFWQGDGLYQNGDLCLLKGGTEFYSKKAFRQSPDVSVKIIGEGK